MNPEQQSSDKSLANNKAPSYINLAYSAASNAINTTINFANSTLLHPIDSLKAFFSTPEKIPYLEQHKNKLLKDVQFFREKDLSFYKDSNKVSFVKFFPKEYSECTTDYKGQCTSIIDLFNKCFNPKLNQNSEPTEQDFESTELDKTIKTIKTLDDFLNLLKDIRNKSLNEANEKSNKIHGDKGANDYKIIEGINIFLNLMELDLSHTRGLITGSVHKTIRPFTTDEYNKMMSDHLVNSMKDNHQTNKKENTDQQYDKMPESFCRRDSFIVANINEGVTVGQNKA